jgi:metal-responsive CopG/Arc/MetJ family transcriptional regulator
VAVQKEMRRLNILVSESMYERLTEMSRQHGETKSDIIRLAVEHEFERRQNVELRRVVSDLAPLYKTDEELSAFTSLDGEDFL